MKRPMTPLLFSLMILMGIFSLYASPLPFSRMDVRGVMPVTELFRVEQNEQALSFNLAESRNSLLQVGSYTLISNNNTSQFKLHIRPGEHGDLREFAFFLDQGETLLPGQRSMLPFRVRVTSDTARAVSVEGSEAMQKDLGVLGVYGNNDSIVFESGFILAEIPDFDPDLFAIGWYSAAIQLSVEVI